MKGCLPPLGVSGEGIGVVCPVGQDWLEKRLGSGRLDDEPPRLQGEEEVEVLFGNGPLSKA